MNPSYNKYILVCCAAAFVGYIGVFMRLPVIPLYADSLNIDTARIGLITSFFFMMAGALSPPLGILSDRFGYRNIACAGMIILAGSMALLGFGQNFIQLTGIHVLMGLGMAAFGPAMMSLVAASSPATHLGRSYGWYTLAVYMGMSLGPGAGGFLAEKISYRPVFLLSGGIMVFTLIFTLVFLPGSNPAGKATPGTRHLKSDLKNILRNRPFAGCLFATLAGCLGLGMLVTFLPLHAQNQGLSMEQTGLVFMMQGMCNALSRIPLGYLSDMVAHRKYLVLAGLVGLALSMIALGLSESILHFILAAGLMGTCMGLAFTSIGALIVETVPPGMRGLAMGGYNACIYFGLMATTAVMGALNQMLGFESGFCITAGFIGITTGLFFLLMKGFSPVRRANMEPLTSEG